MHAIPLVATSLALVNQTGTFVYQSLRAIRDPTDAVAVSAVGELSSLDALENMKHAMMSDIRGRSILKHQPIVDDAVLERARAQPEDSFGRTYAAYMDHNAFTPNGRVAVKHIDDPLLAYVMTRYRQCHDYLHTVTGCGRTVDEELAVKLLEWQHTGLPLGLLAIAGGAPHLSSTQRRHMPLYMEWARQNAPKYIHGEKQTPCYLNVVWEDLLERPLKEVQDLVNITPLAAFLYEKTKEKVKNNL
ncbi:ubiquinone biosynthesis protein-like protein [Strigomonas culicis]|uniref:Ubiquinone biosynthesis protein COQ4 homolog, mitochondrial n=1 Tax=Strigomonas culicis TaxID=28005 RepID=S9W3G0_9TRYP|nr:ubiquinone biosynthesis protein-like protein [Strigomonas culicis]|eukprot:EPY33886.1 ubiquinone biosynthesis protein-like protein [Strigomonas culicis]